MPGAGVLDMHLILFPSRLTDCTVQYSTVGAAWLAVQLDILAC